MVCTLCCMALTAALRTPEEAMQLAASLRGNSQAAHAPARQRLSLCQTAKQKNGLPAVYVFNRGENDGFVLISADDRTHDVLGYSDEGHWDEQNMAPATRAWLEQYATAISRIAATPAVPEQAAPARVPAKKSATYQPVRPLCHTMWGQGNPYNLFCPTYHDTLCPTGCVATAAAQIMKVHQHPAQGTGSSSYIWVNDAGDSVMLSANYATTYNWDLMLNNYPRSATDAQKEAVATLLYHCGVLAEMSYGPRSSGASNNKMLAGMVEHLGYDPGIQVLIKDCMAEDDFIGGIASELQAGRPVMFSARTVRNSGHAFVGDGIDSIGLVHINWGWYGTCDGYFRVSMLDPDNQGTGGSQSNDAYTEEVKVYTHIQPDAGGSYHYTFMCEKIKPYESVTPRTDEWVALQMDYFHNLGITTTAETYSALKVYDANGNFLRYCPYYDWSYDDLPAGYYRYTTYAFGDVSALPAGDYFVSPVVGIHNQYVPVYLEGYIGEVLCPMTITQDSVYLYGPDIETDIPNPNSYTYSELRGYYYPSYFTDVNYWSLQLSTQDFYSNYADQDQMLLQFGITTSSPVSYAGTFLPNDSLYVCGFCNVYHGNINSFDQIATENGEVTIAYHSDNNTYTVDYHFRMNEQEFIGQATVSAAMTFGIYGETYETHYVNDPITLDNERYTAISTSTAMACINAHEVGWSSDIPYMTEGKIESLQNTPDQIMQYGNCRLYLTDGRSSLYGYNTKWYNNQPYPTGYELEVGGKGAIFGKLKYYSADNKEIDRGYFYHYAAPGDEEYTEAVHAQEGTDAQKILQHGHVYIRRNGVTYTITGKRVNE